MRMAFLLSYLEWQGGGGGNIKISNAKMHLVIHLWKDLFKTNVFIKIVLSYNDNERNYRVRQKAHFVTSVFEMRQNFGKL